MVKDKKQVGETFLLWSGHELGGNERQFSYFN